MVFAYSILFTNMYCIMFPDGLLARKKSNATIMYKIKNMSVQ